MSCPAARASCSGVCEFPSLARTFAPAAKSNETTLACPCRAARWSGVLRIPVTRRGFAPRSNKNETTSACPLRAARCKGVAPSSMAALTYVAENSESEGIFCCTCTVHEGNDLLRLLLLSAPDIGQSQCSHGMTQGEAASRDPRPPPRECPARLSLPAPSRSKTCGSASCVLLMDNLLFLLVTPVWPFAAARCAAVSLPSVLALTFAPASMSSATIPAWPLSAATCNRERPFSSAASGRTPPEVKARLTAASSPSNAASHATRVASESNPT